MAHVFQEISVLAGTMGTPFAYVMTRRDYIETGGVGCIVCWRWMHWNDLESHKAGKKHIKKHKDLMEERPGSIEMSHMEWKPNLWEIIFPRELGRDTVISADPDMKLEQYTHPATAGSDTQPMSASNPDGAPEDRAAWAASQATAGDEWAGSQASAVEGRMGEYGGPSYWSEDY
jgi:hypothetical protein